MIFDEPNLNLHRAIISKLWDKLEAIRPDCAFIFTTHDLEFVSSRVGRKYVLRGYDNEKQWEMQEVPQNTGFSEEDVTRILGSRLQILFVEGTESSLDQSVCRACCPDYTIIPRGSCEDVICAVITMRANKDLARITCAGIVDADGRSEENEIYLKRKGIEVLPASEIENAFLFPTVVSAILEVGGYMPREILRKQGELTR